MTPLSLQLCSFLSHRDTSIDLTVSPVIGIQGPNGAGKSSIFDGIRYALFGVARGKPDELVQLGQSDMSVTLTFRHGIDVYRAIRRRTTRSGGKSSLDLHVQVDGGWMPMGGESIAATQAVIERLIGLDVDTFDVAVLLGQGRANRWAEATGTERKATLATILGLGVWDAAKEEAAARRRTLTGTIEAERQQLAAADTQLARRPAVEASLGDWRRDVDEIDERIRRFEASRERAQLMLRDIAAKQATADAAAADVTRLEVELQAADARGKSAANRITAAEYSIGKADDLIARKPEVEDAATKLPAALARVEALEGALAVLHGRETELRQRQDELREIEQEHERATTEYSRRRDLANQRATDLKAHVDGLTPVTCPECRHRFAADPAGLQQAFAQAVADLGAVGKPPDVPVKVARLQGLVQRATENLAAATFDPGALAEARQASLDLLRTEALKDAVAGAEASRADAVTAAAGARDDRMAAGAEWKAARAALVVAQAIVAGADDLRRQRADASRDLDVAAREIRDNTLDQQAARANVARLEAEIAELDRLATVTEQLRATVGEQVIELGRLDTLVKAFGPNGIPARIIAAVLPEIASHANELLAELRPGMTLDLRAQRAAKSRDGMVEALDLVVRDERGERPLSLFSGGERMSVSLALAVALSRLVARRAGTSIRFLGIDEPDGLDRVARSALAGQLEAIVSRRLLDLVLVVTHHEDLAERLPASYRLPELALVA